MANVPTIVVVDDAEDVRALVKIRLRSSGRLAVLAEGANGLQAVELAEEHQPDLLLLDVSMPLMDGLQALPEILKVSPATKVVLYSGFDEQGLGQRGKELGATAFIEKSVSLGRLVDELTAIAVGGAPVVEGPGRDTSIVRAGPAEHEAERILGVHLERFREVFEEAAIGMATLTLSGQIVRANRALAGLVGRDPKELVGTPYAGLAVDDGISDVTMAVSDVFAGLAEVVHVEHGVRARSDGRRLRATIAAVRGEQRQPLYLFLQAQDATAERHAAEQLRQSEERFRLLVEAVSDYAIFMLDPSGRVASWNIGAERAKGYRADEIIGQHFRVFYPQDKQDAKHPEHELELALRDGRYEEEGWRVRKDGTEFWASVVITTVRNDRGEHIGFTKVTRDFTERTLAMRKQQKDAAAVAAANKELAEANQRLARAAADKSQFLAITAHELRGPVGVLGGAADTLAQHWIELTEEERADLFDAMGSSAERLRRLLADLLTTARLEAGAVALNRAPCRLLDVLKRALAGSKAADPQDSVTIDCAVDIELEADADRLAQAVDNLIGNALRHGRPPVRVEGRRTSDGVQIRVSDSGAGVPPEMQARLFEPFTTGARAAGTGLGLFIVRELARMHDGDAVYEPGNDGGPATFVVSIPSS